MDSTSVFRHHRHHIITCPDGWKWPHRLSAATLLPLCSHSLGWCTGTLFSGAFNRQMSICFHSAEWFALFGSGRISRLVHLHSGLLVISMMNQHKTAITRKGGDLRQGYFGNLSQVIWTNNKEMLEDKNAFELWRTAHNFVLLYLAKAYEVTILCLS